MTASLSSPSGEEQFWGSVNAWLEANVPAAANGFTYFMAQALDPATMPQVELSQFNAMEAGSTAMGDMIFPKNPTGHVQGRFNQAYLEVNIRTDGSKDPAALQKMRQLRDIFVYALTNAGQVNETTQALIYPAILVKDDADVSTNTFARVMTEQSNPIVKNFYKPNPPETQIFRYQLLFKMEWVELI